MANLGNTVPCNKGDSIKSGVIGFFYFMLHKNPTLLYIPNFFQWDVTHFARDRVLEGDRQKIHIFSVYFDIETGICASSKFYLSDICTILWQCKPVVCLCTRKYSLCSSVRDKKNKQTKKISTTALSWPTWYINLDSYANFCILEV